MSSDKDQTSTLQSYVDSASSTLNSAIGSLTGNPADKQKAAEKQATADAEKELSHTAVKAGPFTVGPGAISKDSSDRTEGSWNQTIGSAKEALGGLVGAEGLKQEGIRQNREGKGQEAEGQLSDLGKGVKDRVGGTLGGIGASITGDKTDEERYQAQHDEGKTRQRGVEADLQKQDPQY